MYKIQANQSGTRSIEVSDQHLETIDKYQLLRNLVDSNGIIDEEVLDTCRIADMAQDLMVEGSLQLSASLIEEFKLMG